MTNYFIQIGFIWGWFCWVIFMRTNQFGFIFDLQRKLSSLCIKLKIFLFTDFRTILTSLPSNSMVAAVLTNWYDLRKGALSSWFFVIFDTFDSDLLEIIVFCFGLWFFFCLICNDGGNLKNKIYWRKLIVKLSIVLFGFLLDE